MQFDPRNFLQSAKTPYTTHFFADLAQADFDGYRVAVPAECFFTATPTQEGAEMALQVKAQVEKYRKQYYDARHVCWAYMLGPERTVFRANDDGEPSSTAGKPILGQIRSNELTDILVVVIRYFGGIELGTSGLIVAYRTAAAEAIAAAEVEERTVDEEVTVAFEYPYLNGIMRIVKEENPVIVSQQFEMDCKMTLRIRKGAMERLKARLQKVESAYLVE